MIKNKKLLVGSVTIIVISTLIIWIVWGISSEKKSLEAQNEIQDNNNDVTIDSGDGPKFLMVESVGDSIAKFEKFELTIDLDEDYENPYDPEQIDVHAEFVSPSGTSMLINSYYDGVNFKLRFAPDELGEWSYQLSAVDKLGKTTEQKREFTAIDSSHHGWIQLSDTNRRFLNYSDGTSFYGVGVAFPWNINEAGLDSISKSGGNLVTYWNGNYDNSGMGGGKNQLESFSSGIGKYDMMKGFRVDELVDWFEARNMHMNFVIWPHDSLAQHIDWPSTWDQNAYSTLGEAKDFYSDEIMWKHQENLYRYIIARWGHSRAIGIWDLICEINGTDGWLHDQDAANKWVAKVHQYFKEHDPYQHPTKGSMAGGASDYWDEGYRTLDIADRENYYDTHFNAIAADIQQRWERYEKPLFIGETGNLSDANLYHNAVWVALANGLSSSPIWWDMTKVNEDMLGQMKHFASFVSQLDFSEPREPSILQTRIVDKQLHAERPLEDGQDSTDWMQPDWADANKDDNGAVYSVRTEDNVITTSMEFQTGAYAQGVIQQNSNNPDWIGMSELIVDVYLDNDNGNAIKARPVLFPNGQWTEGDTLSDVILKSGEWTTLRIPLINAPSGYWRDGKMMSEDDLRKIAQWGIKVYSEQSTDDAKPTQISVKNARLYSEQAPIVQVKESQGWLMIGSNQSYGWLVTEQGTISGKSAEISGLVNGKVQVEWYDPWEGRVVSKTNENVINGTLMITAPLLERPDIAVQIYRE